MEDERRKPKRVVAMEVREKDDRNVARIHTEAVHVRKERRATIQQHTAVDHHGSVVAVERKRGAATEEREL
jgi:hypothetical protein